jgi:hypothetical protein
MANFVFRVSREVMAKFCQIPDLCWKVWSIQNFRFSKSIKFLTAVTRKSLTIWSRLMDHQKSERVAYQFGIRDFRSFGQSKAQKLSSVQPLFCLGTEFSSDVDRQNPVTSKPFAGWCWISNRSKAGRVAHLFSIQLQERIPSELPQILFFFRRCNLSRIQFQQLHSCPKILTHKPPIVWGWANDRWKPGKVIFHFVVQLMVGFCIEQSRCHFSLLLLLIEVKLL